MELLDWRVQLRLSAFFGLPFPDQQNEKALASVSFL